MDSVLIVSVIVAIITSILGPIATLHFTKATRKATVVNTQSVTIANQAAQIDRLTTRVTELERMNKRLLQTLGALATKVNAYEVAHGVLEDI